LRQLDAEEGFFWKGGSPIAWFGQRKKLRKKATVQGFKYPWTHAQPDIVRVDTLKTRYPAYKL
jgi:hypothetical protein